jgi:hypothetical protein
LVPAPGYQAQIALMVALAVVTRQPVASFKNG